MPIYLLIYHSEPPKEDIDPEIIGAFINCWIDATDIELAETIAKHKIKELGWQIIETEDAYELIEGNFEDSKSLEYYNQALIDKEVYVIHTYASLEDE